MSAQNGATTRLAGLNRHGDLGWLFDTSGNISDTSIYDPFGKPLAQTGSTGANVGFQGDYTDPTSGDVWMGARWYTPSNATFRSRDTIRGMLQTPTSLNRYTHAGGNPINYFDPDGRMFFAIDELNGLACAVLGDAAACAEGRWLPNVYEFFGVWFEDGYPRGYMGADIYNGCPAGWSWGGYYGDGKFERGQCATWNCVPTEIGWGCDAEPQDCSTPWLNGDYNVCGGDTCAAANHHIIAGYCKYQPPATIPTPSTPEPPFDWNAHCTNQGLIYNGEGCVSAPTPPVTTTPAPNTSGGNEGNNNGTGGGGDQGGGGDDQCADYSCGNTPPTECGDGRYLSSGYCVSVCTLPTFWNGTYCEDPTVWDQPGDTGGSGNDGGGCGLSPMSWGDCADKVTTAVVTVGTEVVDAGRTTIDGVGAAWDTLSDSAKAIWENKWEIAAKAMGVIGDAAEIVSLAASACALFAEAASLTIVAAPAGVPLATVCETGSMLAGVVEITAGIAEMLFAVGVSDPRARCEHIAHGATNFTMGIFQAISVAPVELAVKGSSAFSTFGIEAVSTMLVEPAFQQLLGANC